MADLSPTDFAAYFAAVHGPAPFPWQARLAADQAFEFGVQCAGQGIGKRGEQYPRVGMIARQIHSAVQRHNGLAGACRA